MQFPDKENARRPKAPRDFPPRKNAILHLKSGCHGTPLRYGLYGWVDVRWVAGWVVGRTLMSQPKFLGSIGYQSA